MCISWHCWVLGVSGAFGSVGWPFFGVPECDDREHIVCDQMVVLISASLTGAALDLGVWCHVDRLEVLCSQSGALECSSVFQFSMSGCQVVRMSGVILSGKVVGPVPRDVKNPHALHHENDKYERGAAVTEFIFKQKQCHYWLHKCSCSRGDA